MAKLQGLKRDTVQPVYGTVDYTIELTCGHRKRATKKQLEGPERIVRNACPDDAEHAKPSLMGPLQKVLDHYQDRDGYMEHLACGHHIASRTMHRDRVPERRRCPKCGPGTKA